MLLVTCCASACGGEEAESPEPMVPGVTPMSRRSRLRSSRRARSSRRRQRSCCSPHSTRACASRREPARGDSPLKCHGRPNQRWAFTPQPDGSLQIVGLGGSCIGGTAPGNQLEITSCASPASRYRFDGGRVVEVASGECLTTSDFKSGARIFLDRCDPMSSGQLWMATALDR